MQARNINGRRVAAWVWKINMFLSGFVSFIVATAMRLGLVCMYMLVCMYIHVQCTSMYIKLA